TFFRAAFYFPAIASSAAIVVLFTFLTQPDGLINTLLGFVGIESDLNWTNNPGTALPAIMVLAIWTTSGTMMLFYLSALQTISREVYEAAALDGANWWSAFWRITFPLLRPAHFFVAVISVIGALQMFDQSFIAGGADGEPANSLTTMVLFLYRATAKTFEFGYAATVGVVLLVFIMSLTLIQRRLFGEASVG
ncbi:MAG: carbohydrate ABC transporter permease, partial [Candidatus Limnocylindria bacterium]